MSAQNTHKSYGSLTKTFHWLTALLILSLIPLGSIANDLPYDTPEQLTRKAFLFSVHKTLGVTLFFVALARILWAVRQIKPGSLNPDRKMEHWAAETVHWLLYGSLVLVPLSGWIHHAATTGFAPIWWPLGQNLPLVPKSDSVASVFAGLHIVFIRVMIVSLLLHVAGALKHHVIDKDQTLRRMWFGKNTAPDVAHHHHSSVPIVSAVVAWGVALGVGASLGMYASHAADIPQTELAEVASEWTVTDGAIDIEITQFGSQVQGTFADWTAAIRFDPEIAQGTAGDVAVTIAIPSLTLGSVTDQALGADYFNVETHPTATFAADITTIPDGYAATGTLTIKDATVPVTLPFALTVDGDTATMQSQVTLNRMDFGIGTNMADETSLNFAVTVTVAVTATRSGS